MPTFAGRGVSRGQRNGSPRPLISVFWTWSRHIFIQVAPQLREVCKEKVNTKDELVAHIMRSAALIKQKRQDDLRRATRAVTKRAEKCIEVDDGIFEHLL